MDKLSNLLFEVLTVLAVFLLIFFSIIFICIKISTTWYKKRLKQIQSYHEMQTNTPELQPYLDQGYQLLIVIQNNKSDSSVSKTEVFDYPNRGSLNPLPLFSVDYHFSSKSAELNNKNCSTEESEYTEQLPLNTSASYTKGKFLPDSTFHVKKDGEPFLQMNYPTFSFKEGLCIENAYHIISSYIPEAQQWRWDFGKKDTECEYRFILTETITNRALIAILPADPFSCLLVHPEMPKALVPVFVELSLHSSSKRKRTYS